MIYFGIPLRSRESSNNWARIELLFNRTLWSLYNQTSPNFRIIIACHDIPKLTRNYDSRVEFLKVDIETPKNLYQQMCDKGYKVHAIGLKIRKYGGGFTLIADADDLYSNQIASFVENNTKEFGWVMKTGYEFFWTKNFLKLSFKHPEQPIVKYGVEDLPENLLDAYDPSAPRQKYLIRKGHGDIAKYCKNNDRTLKKFPFIGHIYVKYHGDNHSILNGQDSIYRRISRCFMPKIDLIKNEKIRNEFSIDWL